MMDLAPYQSWHLLGTRKTFQLEDIPSECKFIQDSGVSPPLLPVSPLDWEWGISPTYPRPVAFARMTHDRSNIRRELSERRNRRHLHEITDFLKENISNFSEKQKLSYYRNFRRWITYQLQTGLYYNGVFGVSREIAEIRPEFIFGPTTQLHSTIFWSVDLVRSHNTEEKSQMLGLSSSKDNSMLPISDLLHFHLGECWWDFARSRHSTDVHVTILPQSGVFLCILLGGKPRKNLNLGLSYNKHSGKLLWYINTKFQGCIARGLDTWNLEFRPFFVSSGPRPHPNRLYIRGNSPVIQLKYLCRHVIRQAILKQKTPVISAINSLPTYPLLKKFLLDDTDKLT